MKRICLKITIHARVKIFLFLWGLICSPIDLMAQQSESMLTVGSWIKADDGSVVKIPFSALLSEKQRRLIESGFTTYSRILLVIPGVKDKIEDRNHAVNCTIKYNTWLEVYEVVQIKEVPKPLTVKSFDELADLCFFMSLTSNDLHS